MRFRLGCSITQDLAQPTPMIATLNVHPSRAADLEAADLLVASPATDIHCFQDGFGNWRRRLVAPAGRFTLTTDGVIRDSGALDQKDPTARQHPVEELDPTTLTFLLGSRYCETDCLSEEAWRLFGDAPPGWPRVQAVCDFVHRHVVFGYEHSLATRTAAQTYVERRGVCRDFAHLAIAFCRCLNIPARYCTGYVSDVGAPPPRPPMDFSAWMEVYLGGRWRVFDPRNNAPRIGRVLVARGRDAVDVPLTHVFGPSVLVDFRVWIDQITG